MTRLRRKDCFLDSRLSRDGGLMYVIHDFIPFNRAAVGTSCAFRWDRAQPEEGHLESLRRRVVHARRYAEERHRLGLDCASRPGKCKCESDCAHFKAVGMVRFPHAGTPPPLSRRLGLNSMRSIRSTCRSACESAQSHQLTIRRKPECPCLPGWPTSVRS